MVKPMLQVYVAVEPCVTPLSDTTPLTGSVSAGQATWPEGEREH